MRKQYHFRQSDRGLLAWDVDKLVDLTSDLTPEEVPLSTIRELDEPFWYGCAGDVPTCRSVALRARLMSETDLKYPIILSQDGGVMDGMHRVCKALTQGKKSILVVQLQQDPEPDYVGVDPEDLPYEERKAEQSN
ncbi:MAG: hypothetical protein KAR40_16315 [Candidatus Sabulitectum sp.]|nr:hypothetical protein [Candidatus Sabulitectum sp.]